MNKLQRYKTLFNSGRTQEARDFLEASPPINRLSTETFVVKEDPLPVPNYVSYGRDRSRLDEGLRFLELVSINSIGKNTNSVLNFDTVEIFMPLSRFRSALSNDEKLSIMYTSLGITEVINNINGNNTILNMLNNKLLKAYNNILEGTFRVNDQAELISLVRIVSRKGNR